MKKLFAPFCIMLILLAYSCTVGKLTESSDYLPEENENPTQTYYTNLADAIKATGKAFVSGTGDIRIRGMNSITGDTRPFFFVNDIPMGRDYQRVNNAFNVQQMDKLEIIGSLSELAVYGANGNSGVIKITTKKAGRTN